MSLGNLLFGEPLATYEEAVQSSLSGKRLTIRIPDRLAASLPPRQAYTFKLAGAR